MDDALRYLEKQAAFIPNSFDECVTIVEAIEAIRIGIAGELDKVKKLYLANKLNEESLNKITKKYNKYLYNE